MSWIFLCVYTMSACGTAHLRMLSECADLINAEMLVLGSANIAADRVAYFDPDLQDTRETCYFWSQTD
jgi:hypothetical protein